MGVGSLCFPALLFTILPSPLLNGIAAPGSEETAGCFLSVLFHWCLMSSREWPTCRGCAAPIHPDRASRSFELLREWASRKVISNPDTWANEHAPRCAE